MRAMKARLIAALAVYATPVPSAYAGDVEKIPGVGDRAVMTAPFFACKERRDTERIIQLGVHQGDRAAAIALGSARCEWIEPGFAGVVEDKALLKDAVCIRRAGRPDCLWTRLSLAEKQ